MLRLLFAPASDGRPAALTLLSASLSSPSLVNIVPIKDFSVFVVRGD